MRGACRSALVPYYTRAPARSSFRAKWKHRAAWHDYCEPVLWRIVAETALLAPERGREGICSLVWLQRAVGLGRWVYRGLTRPHPLPDWASRPPVVPRDRLSYDAVVIVILEVFSGMFGVGVARIRGLDM